MKKLSALLFAGLVSFSLQVGVASACEGHDKPAAKEKKNQEVKQLASASFKVEGMHCAGCGDKVKSALAQKDGIVSVDVKIADGRVVVQYDAAKLKAADIAKAISDAGYKATAEA